MKNEHYKDADLTRVEGRDEPAAGEVIVVPGRVVDESGAAVASALLQL